MMIVLYLVPVRWHSSDSEDAKKRRRIMGGLQNKGRRKGHSARQEINPGW